MKRPGPVGFMILLAFTVVAAIEFRTVLGLFGVEVRTQVYYMAGAVVVGLLVAALLTLPAEEQAETSKI